MGFSEFQESGCMYCSPRAVCVAHVVCRLHRFRPGEGGHSDTNQVGASGQRRKLRDDHSAAGRSGRGRGVVPVLGREEQCDTRVLVSHLQRQGRYGHLRVIDFPGQAAGSVEGIWQHGENVRFGWGELDFEL